MKNRDLIFAVKMIGMLILGTVLSLFVHTHSWACDIAVVSAAASSNGRPLIWKSRDNSASHEQEIQYFEAVNPDVGGYIMVYDHDEWANINNGTPINPSGGVNEAGFAITCTSVYEDFLPHHEWTNVNTDLNRLALQECVSLDDFEELLSRWHETHPNKVISGNFAVIDAHGGAALYECYTGLFPFFDNHIRYRKYDANSAKDDDGNFIGFVNRTNSNSYIPFNYGEERRWRAYDLMKDMVEGDRLNYRNVMLEVAKDVITSKGDDYDPGPEEDYSTTYCISRAQTRLAFVVDGVTSDDDPRLVTFWCNLGEPSIGVYVPLFPYAKDVSFYVWADDFDDNEDPFDIDDSCLLNRAISDREIYDQLIYDSNTGDYYNGMDDFRINKIELAVVQEWTFPLDDFIVDKTEEFMNNLRDIESRITENNLLDFSDFCAEYAYENYTHASSDYYAWSYSMPWDDVPPTISSTNPDSDAEDVAVDLAITVIFSESINPSTIDNSTFSLNDDSTSIEGVITFMDSKKKMIFKPNSTLEYDTTYSAIITTKAEDLAGNPLQEDYSWIFTTVNESTSHDDSGDEEISLGNDSDNDDNGQGDDTISPLWFLPSDSSSDGCGSPAFASVHYSSNSTVFPGIVTNIWLILFPYSMILFHRIIKRRRKRE
ncbi:MAG: Ig-like domain-containing protein [Spirochaetota bacterium]|nr:Ig-like domain-containing protein [Spirochaetota bacterium]